MPRRFVTGIVLAAGGSTRLGQPKQLLPYRGATLLDAVLGVAHASRLDQVVVALGGSATTVRATADLSGTDVVVNEAFGNGCSSSIAAAMRALDFRTDVVVLLLGDQPGVRPETVGELLARRGEAPIAVTRYVDGRGHPFAFGRDAFGDLRELHGDKAVWKLLERRAADVVEVPAHGRVPLDVDTWDDYEAVLAAGGGAA